MPPEEISSDRPSVRVEVPKVVRALPLVLNHRIAQKELSERPSCCELIYSQLAFSPDLKKIALRRLKPDGSIDIYVMDLTYDANEKITGASAYPGGTTSRLTL